MIDVILPFSTEFSTEEELERAKSSVENQTIETELIVIDEVVEDEEINGASWARNKGLEESENRYAAFLDADDYWRKDKLEKQIERLKNSQAGICLTRPDIQSKYVDPNPSFSKKSFPKQVAYGKWVSLTSSILIDKQKISVKFNESIYRFEDHLFILKAIEESEFDFIDEKLTIVNKTDRGMSANEDFDKKLKAREKFFEELEGRFDFVPQARGYIMAKNYRWKGREHYFSGNYRKSMKWYARSLNKDIQLKTLGAYILSYLKTI